jgi:hypothetical protein
MPAAIPTMMANAMVHLVMAEFVQSSWTQMAGRSSCCALARRRAACTVAVTSMCACRVLYLRAHPRLGALGQAHSSRVRRRPENLGNWAVISPGSCHETCRDNGARPRPQLNEVCDEDIDCADDLTCSAPYDRNRPTHSRCRLDFGEPCERHEPCPGLQWQRQVRTPESMSIRKAKRRWFTSEPYYP